MVIPGTARPIGRTVHIGYVSALLCLISFIVAVGYTPAAFAASKGGGGTGGASKSSSGSSAPLGNTLGGLVTKTVPAVAKTVDDVTAPVTDAVSPSLTKAVAGTTSTVSNTVAPAVVNTVEKVATPVVNTVGTVAPVVPTAVHAVDTVAAPVTTTIAPAAANTVDTVASPVTKTVGAVVSPVTAPVSAAVAPVANSVAPVAQTATSPVANTFRAITPVNTTLQRTTITPLARTSPIPLVYTFAASNQPTIYSDFTNFIGTIRNFFTGVLPPSTWLPGDGDTSRALSLSMMLFSLLFISMIITSSGGMYRRLRETQHDIYFMREDTALETAIHPKAARVSAASTTAVVIGVAIVYAIMLSS